MTDQADTSGWKASPVGGPGQVTAESTSYGDGAVAPTPAGASIGGPAAGAADRPEVVVGAAFAGGFVLALILKRLAR